MAKLEYGKEITKEKALDYAIRNAEIEDCACCGYEIGEKKKYWNYMSKTTWDGFVEEMKAEQAEHHAQYMDGDGGELKEKPGRWGLNPPKMASYGSSSRMIYKLSKDIEGFVFEKQLPTHVGRRPANLDGFIQGESDIFVEAKCREIYASHKNVKIADVYLKVYNEIDGTCNDFSFEKNDCSEEGYKKITFTYRKKELVHFDMKQLICHFLGITANILENKANPNVKFIYLIFNPEHDTNFEDTEIKRFRKRLIKDYERTLEEIESMGDMKWLFDAVMQYQVDHLGLTHVSCNFEFKLADQTNYTEKLS